MHFDRATDDAFGQGTEMSASHVVLPNNDSRVSVKPRSLRPLDGRLRSRPTRVGRVPPPAAVERQTPSDLCAGLALNPPCLRASVARVSRVSGVS